MHDFVFSLRNSKLILQSNPKIISFNTVFFLTELKTWLNLVYDIGSKKVLC